VSDETVRGAARYLLDAHRAGERFGPIPAGIAPRSVSDAYAVQDAFVSLKARQGEPPAGYKLALTTPQMRRMVGHDDSIAGVLLHAGLHLSPAKVRASDYTRLLVEFEIGLELDADLPATEAPFARGDVASAVAAVMPALELADDRDADYAGLAQNFLHLIADNAWNEGAVLGPPARDWRRLDLADLRGIAAINGVQVGEGRGGDALGHPLEALAWLANHLARRGRSLRQGDVVITGSLVTSKFPRAGDHVQFSIEHLGQVDLAIE
jgi:2-keto-4-pentenoate hydratase